MTRRRLRQAVLLAPPVARSLRPAPFIAGAVLALAVARMPQDPVVGARLGAVALCLGSGFLFDDPAATTVAPAPPSLFFRRVHRVAIWLPLLAVVWTLVLWSAKAPGVGERSLELAAMLSITLTASAWSGGLAAGPIVLALFVADAFVAALFPSLAGGAWDGARAGLLLAVGVSGLVWLSTDPAHSSRPRMTLRRVRAGDERALQE